MNLLGVFAAVALTILIVGAPIALWVDCKSAFDDYRFRQTLACRKSLSCAEFIAAFYDGTNIPANIPLRLRPIYGKYFELDPAKIHPSDLPPDIYDFDTEPLVNAIEKEFGIVIDGDQQERTTGKFDSIVKCVFRITHNNQPIDLDT